MNNIDPVEFLDDKNNQNLIDWNKYFEEAPNFDNPPEQENLTNQDQTYVLGDFSVYFDKEENHLVVSALSKPLSIAPQGKGLVNIKVVKTSGK